MKEKPIAYAGIDPRLTGDIAVISGNRIEFVDYPGDPVQLAHEIIRLVRKYRFSMIYLESVSSRPGQGIASTGKFMRNFGQWDGILSMLNRLFRIPYKLIRPAEWQKGIIKPSDGSDPKERSLAVARRLFPNAELTRKKDHNRADALLMAYKAKLDYERTTGC